MARAVAEIGQRRLQEPILGGRYVVMVTWVPKPILQIDMDAVRLSIRVVYAANISNFVFF